MRSVRGTHFNNASKHRCFQSRLNEIETRTKRGDLKATLGGKNWRAGKIRG